MRNTSLTSFFVALSYFDGVSRAHRKDFYQINRLTVNINKNRWSNVKNTIFGIWGNLFWEWALHIRRLLPLNICKIGITEHAVQISWKGLFFYIWNENIEANCRKCWGALKYSPADLSACHCRKAVHLEEIH